MEMATTIQVSDETRKLLEARKKELGLRSYDQVVEGLIRPKAGVPESLFGACKGSRSFVRKGEQEHEF
jgi:hypothetical protein